MRIYPAIDIKNGVCVRLRMGDMQQATEYGEPSKMALRWQQEGAEALHVVDLDAAFAGEFSNRGMIAGILKAVSVPVQLGGGIRTMEDIDERLDFGIWRVIIGTAAFEDPGLVAAAALKYPGRIVVGIDAKNGKVAIKGWADETTEDPVSLALKMKSLGIKTIIYTDITRDGMLTGPNIEGIADMVDKTGMDIIASGGISSLDDLYKLNGTGAEGVIIGKALYTGVIDLKQAIKAGADIC
jgi:phosphoribosylformimino-5-aminoimidazole carboxamide ribotide isomerase